MKKFYEKILLIILSSFINFTPANAISAHYLSLAISVLKNVVELHIGGALLCYAYEGEQLEVKMPGSDENIISLSPKKSLVLGGVACSDALIVGPAIKCCENYEVAKLKGENKQLKAISLQNNSSCPLECE